MNSAIDQFRNRFEPGILVFLLLCSTGFDAPSPIKTAANALLYLIVPFLIICERKRMMLIFTKDVWVLLLTGCAVLSIFWSTAPQVTAILVRALLLRTALGMYLAVRYSPKELLRLLTWVFGIAAVLSLALTGHQGSAWTGIFSQKNEFARIMAVGALLCIANIVMNRKQWQVPTVLLGISGLLLVLSQGRSALVVFIFTLGISVGLYWLMSQHYKLRVAILPVVLILVGVATTFIINNYDYILLEVLKKPVDLNGRLPLWSYLIERGTDKLWLGFGYGAFFNTREEALDLFLYTWYGKGVSPREVIFSTDMSSAHAHSGILDLFLSLGIVGLVIFAFSFFTVLGRLLELLRHSHYKQDVYWMLVFLIFMVVLNSTITGTILHQKHLFWIIYVTIAFSTGIQIEQLKQSRLSALSVPMYPALSVRDKSTS